MFEMDKNPCAWPGKLCNEGIRVWSVERTLFAENAPKIRWNSQILCIIQYCEGDKSGCPPGLTPMNHCLYYNSFLSRILTESNNFLYYTSLHVLVSTWAYNTWTVNRLYLGKEPAILILLYLEQSRNLKIDLLLVDHEASEQNYEKKADYGHNNKGF